MVAFHNTVISEMVTFHATVMRENGRVLLYRRNKKGENCGYLSLFSSLISFGVLPVIFLKL
jgi:hypothetical protein